MINKNIGSIFKNIEYANGEFPSSQIEYLFSNYKECKDYLLEYIKKISFQDDNFDYRENYMGAIYTTIILAYFCEKEFMDVILKILKKPYSDIENIYNENISGNLRDIIFMAYDNELFRLIKLVKSDEVDQRVKFEIIYAIEKLVLSGKVSKDEVANYYKSILNGNLQIEDKELVKKILYSSIYLKMCGFEKYIKNEEFDINYVKLREANKESSFSKDDIVKRIMLEISEYSCYKKRAQNDNFLGEGIEILNEVIEKRFRNPFKSFELEYILNDLNRDELYSICRELSIKNISRLRKDILKQLLMQNYLEKLKKTLMYFEEKSIKYLRTFIKSNGIKFINSKEELFYGMNFAAWGFIFPYKFQESKVFIMPECTLELIKCIDDLSFMCKIKKNSEYLKLISGMSEVYGILKNIKIKRLLNYYNMDEDIDYIKSLININQTFNDYYWKNDYLINRNVEDNIEYIEDLIECSPLDYAIIDKKELISIVEDYNILNNENEKEFIRDFNKNFKLDESILLSMMKSLNNKIQVEDCECLLNKTLQLLKEEENRRIMKRILTKYLNNIRLWRYKGHTLNEVKTYYMQIQ